MNPSNRPSPADLPSPTELRNICERLARDAGRIAFGARREVREIDSDTKSSTTDLVTEYDRAAEASIVAWIREHRPDDAIVGEEGTSVAGTSGLEWHIDPIDGTTNFVYDQPAWACSIGVRNDRATLAGAVYAPALDELFSAAQHRGATCNGEPISTSRTTDLSLALVSTGFSFDPQRRVRQGAAVTALLGHIRDIRRLGAASVDLCFVACGRSDVYFETGLNSWDMLAGELIAREAGARSSDRTGADCRPTDVVVAAPGVHEAFLTALDDAGLVD